MNSVIATQHIGQVDHRHSCRPPHNKLFRRSRPWSHSKFMADGRKRRGLPGLSGTRARGAQRRRTTDDNRGSLVGAVAMVLVVAGLVAVGASSIAQSCMPRTRRPIYDPIRLDWGTHVKDLRQRGPHCFKRFYRMDVSSFNKLAELLRPLLEPNAHFGGELLSESSVPSILVRRWQEPQRVNPIQGASLTQNMFHKIDSTPPPATYSSTAVPLQQYRCTTHMICRY